MRRSYRYRIYPTGRQTEALEAQIVEACDLYNAALDQRRRAWREHGLYVGYHDQSAQLRELRAAGLIDSSANFWSQQAVLRRLDRAFQAFFRRVKAGEKPGYPRFRSRRRFDTLEFSFAGHAGGIELTDQARLRVQGVGHVKVKLHRAIPAEAKLCEARVSRRNGRWYVSIALDAVAPRPLPATGRAVGLDMGVQTFAATSDGELIAGPRANRTAAAAVRRAQRKVARRKRGSNRRRKAVGLLARQREHEANVRRDHAHKRARTLVERYDTICVEQLNYRGLAKGMLARDCNDQGWASFVALLAEKAEDAARRLVLVDPKNTSQACSACGAIVTKTLGVRVHHCACGYRADRDVNAARNILARGLGWSLQAPTVGAEVHAVA
ncbi:MAG TPA: transposase [Solirubrobacteraceae bacterium]|nr:transposase [Solirubrobacteraceae bacterium]